MYCASKAVAIETKFEISHVTMLRIFKAPLAGLTVSVFIRFVQIQLLQTLSAENLKVLSTCPLTAPLKHSAKTPSDSSVALSPEDVFRERFDKIDSGFESARTNLTAKFSKGAGGISNLSQVRTQHNGEKAVGIENEVPWEVFLTGRKLTAAVYSRVPMEEKPAVEEFRSKPNLPGRGKTAQIKPVLRVELVHPALIVNTQSSGPRIQVSCFDVNVAGTSPTTGDNVNFHIVVSSCWRHGGLMVGALASGSSPDWGHCAVFLPANIILGKPCDGQASNPGEVASCYRNKR